MNIYDIWWTQDNSVRFNAVIIADDKDDAMRELNLDMTYNDDVIIERIGKTVEGHYNTKIVCHSAV